MRTQEVIVVVLTAVVATGWIARRLGWSSPALLVITGCLIGLLPEFRSVVVPPDVVLVLFLPALLYWESLTSSLREIRTNLRAILLAATLLVLATAATVAVVAHWLGLPWPLAFVLGAVVAPTDATAVASVARDLPRRILVTLRTESLINDGTALALFAVVIGVAADRTTPSRWRVAGDFLLAYGGGVAIGAAVAAVVIVIRRNVEDPSLEGALSVLTPFAAYFPAEAVEASGVLAVVTCGLVMSQGVPRITNAVARVQVGYFWDLTTFLLNGALFVLVGIQTPAIVESVGSARSLLNAGLITLVVAGTRVAWIYTTPYVIRLIDRRPKQRLLRMGARQRLPFAWGGVRGAVSLAAALAVPPTVENHEMVVFTALIVILATLLLQGQTMPLAIRWARLPPDDAVATEEAEARRRLAEAALAALPETAAALGTPDGVAEAVATDLNRRHASDGSRADLRAELELRRAIVGVKRQTLIQLRDDGAIDDIVLRSLQTVLDTEDIRIDLALRSE